MSSRALPLVLAAALVVPLALVVAAPAAADPPSGSPFDFLPVEAIESPKQVRDDGAVLVEVTVRDAAALPAVEAEIAAAAEIVTVAADYGVVVAWAQPAVIDAISARGDVLSVVSPAPPSSAGASAIAPAAALPDGWIAAPSCRAIPSESDGPLQAAFARADGGVDGTGVTVGVISDSFDVSTSAATDAAQDVALGALPGPGNPCGYTTPVTVVSDNVSGADEGRAMAQLVHGIAPGARLLFANGFPSAYVMAENIRALVDAGADIIVDDLSFYTEPIAQAGVVADSIRYARDAGVAYYSSAANASILNADAESIGGWASSSFTTATCPPPLAADPTMQCLDFSLDTPDPDATNRMTLTRAGDGTLNVTTWLRWSNPWYGIDAPLGMALLTTDPVSPQVVAASLCSDAQPTAPETCSQPWSAMTLSEAASALPAGDTVELDLVVFSPADPATLADIEVAMTFRANSGWLDDLEQRQSGTGQGRDVTVGATLTVNNAAQGVFAVGAADVATPDRIEEFSSWGATTWHWESVSSQPVGMPAGPLATTWSRTGADAVGVDGALTTFFGDGNRFFGTSAAAPSVAAVSALLMQAAPDLTDLEIDDLLRDTANPAIATPPGVPVSSVIGAGRVDAVAALAASGATPHPLAAPVPAKFVPADTAVLIASQSSAGIPELVATVVDGVATVGSLPAELEGWAWVYGYSAAADLGWRPVVDGTLSVGVAGWSVGQHHLALFRGDELVATVLVAVPSPGSTTLPATGADPSAAVVLALGLGLVGLALVGARRRRPAPTA